jgi:ligand-binding sensor domain-containing protein/two-component sensor histidine kinase
MIHRMSVLFRLSVCTIVFASAVFTAQKSYAQQLPYLQWSTADGLAQSQVRSIHQDHLGYLWFGTLGGVSRFDGQDFDNFARQDGLLGNQVNAITELGDSLMVFGSLGGLTLYNGQQFSNVRFPEATKSAQVNHFFTAADGTLHIATERGQLLYRDSLFAGDTIFDDLHLKRHFEAEVDGEMTLFTVAKAGVFRRKSGGWQQVLDARQDLGATLMDAVPDGEGGLYLATIGRGLLHWSRDPDRQWDGHIRAFLPENGLISVNISGFNQSGDHCWIRSREGFSRLDLATAELRAYGSTTGLDPVDVRAILEDRAGNVWLGTNGGGVLKFLGEAVQHFNTAHGMSGDIVMAALRQGDALWFGTYDNGITRLQDSTYTHFDMNDGLRSTRVWCAVKTADESVLWFGTSGGLSRFENGQFVTYTTDDGLPHNQVLSLFVDTDATLYAGTARGLVRYNALDDTFTEVDDAPGTKVRAIRRHRDGYLWLATNSGVYALKENSVLHVSESNGLPDNSVYCIESGPDGTLWAGTESGLCRIDASGRVSELLLEGGFGANHVNFIAFDADNAWLGTNAGVFQSQNADDPDPKWRSLARHDGVIYLETNQNAVLLDGDVVWVGTSEALTRIDRTDLAEREANDDIRVHLSEIRVNLEPPVWQKYGQAPESYGSWPTYLEVPHTDNHFTFFFDALSPGDPEGVQYQYRLNGIDDDWEAWTETDFASYSQLPYEDLVFEVRARNRAGEQSDIASFAFTVRPPFWLSWWFVTLEVLAVFGILFLIYRSRRRAFIEKVEKEKLEYRSKMLALEQQTLNSSMNRHFIFNALNSIQYYINRKDRVAANRYLSSFAKLIRKNLDSSQVNFTSLREEIERLQLYLDLEHMRFKDKFDYTIDVADDVDQEAIKVPSMLLQPFLENSIWHGILPMEKAGHIEVKIAMSGPGAVAFTVTDNGIGIETSRRNKEQREDHISQGMTITSGRIELIRRMTKEEVVLKGPYELQNGQDDVIGTRVELILPLDFQRIYAN